MVGQPDIRDIVAKMAPSDSDKSMLCQVLRLNTPSTTHYNKGRTFASHGMHEEALECYDMALKLDPQDGYAYVAKGESCARLGMHEDALGCYDQALKIDPQNAVVHFNKGRSLELLGRHKESVEYYHAAMSLDAASVHKYIASTYAPTSLHIHKEFLKYCDKKSITRAKGPPLTNIHKKKQDGTLEPHPISIYAYTHKIDSLAALGKYEESLAYYDKVLDIHPQNGIAHVIKGRSLAQIGRYEEALACYDKALELDPENGYARVAKDDLPAHLVRHKKTLEHRGKKQKSNIQEARVTKRESEQYSSSKKSTEHHDGTQNGNIHSGGDVDLADMVRDLQKARLGDQGWLAHILDRIENGKDTYDRDRQYVEKKFRHLQDNIKDQRQEDEPPTHPKDRTKHVSEDVLGVHPTHVPKHAKENVVAGMPERPPEHVKERSTLHSSSRAWYLLPIFLGVLGGAIAYTILRKRHRSRARKTWWLGLGLTAIHFTLMLVAG